VHVGVVDHRVVHAVALDRRGQRLVVALVLELGGVDAYYDEGVTEALFQWSNFVEDVEAVYTAERPEVEEDDLAFEGV
jgi:hypothetical protein